MRLRYSFVIDEHPRFLAQGGIFLRTLLAAGVPTGDIVAQVTQRSGEAGRRLAARFGVRALELPLGPDKAYCNKINQLFTLADDDFDVLVCCDTDLAILRPLDDVARADTVRARRVDLENPPLPVLEEARALLGFPETPALIGTGCDPQAMTYALNCNGGLLLIPRQLMQALGESWLGYAATLVANRQIMQHWVSHIDQVSWAFAMLRLRLPFEELPVEYNFPIGLAGKLPEGSYGRPVVLHHHNAIRRNGRIRKSGVPLVDQSINEANRRLGRRLGLDFRTLTALFRRPASA